ncbi:IgGFc-binding protein-like [Puntigrus tetrazona]|uniref:IgGFc-binding protein-like n=1 Tax=Puntigrus tetrazona TaxID=1606681 RepID=UPI001C895FF8|nr:IgGFc-binding protein-like [Puntigrus tetrazona]
MCLSCWKNTQKKIILLREWKTCDLEASAWLNLSSCSINCPENQRVTMMLFHLLFMSLVCSGVSVENYGKYFITAFPENIAYYHPQESSNTLQMTAFYDDTLVSITINHTNVYNDTLQSGQTKIVHFPKYIEQYRFTKSLFLVKVNSTEKIVVLWLSKRGDSVQSNFVQPLRNLGKWYSIPFINYNQMMASLYNMSDQLAPDNWRYNSFRLIVINAEHTVNFITVQSISPDGQKTFNITLKPYELYQIQTNGSNVKLYSSAIMAVLLTHPCVETTGCDCNMVVSHVLPQNLWGDTFVVPSLKNLNTAWLQVTNTTKIRLNGRNIKTQESNSSELIPFPDLKRASQFISASNEVSIRLISPGLVLELIPETMFAACYLVQINSTEGEAVIIAETASKNSVYIDGKVLKSTDWKPIPNSNYSSISVSLNGMHVIWHPTSKIGVYRFEKMESGIPYGSPAIVLNEDPDRDGCVADSAQFITTTDVMTWPQSHHYCLNISYQLSTPSSEMAQKELTSFLQNNGSHGYLWIGLRRSLSTLEWYWQKGNDSEYSVSYTKWADGHPDKPWKALCAAVSQDANKEFSWKSMSCCTKLRPICYKQGKYFNDMTFNTLYDQFSITYPKVCSSCQNS